MSFFLLSSTSSIWKPKELLKTSLTIFNSESSITFLNKGSYLSEVDQPKLPPSNFEPGSSEYNLARTLNSSPSDILFLISLINSSACLSLLISEV